MILSLPTLSFRSEFKVKFCFNKQIESHVERWKVIYWLRFKKELCNYLIRFSALTTSTIGDDFHSNNSRFWSKRGTLLSNQLTKNCSRDRHFNGNTRFLSKIFCQVLITMVFLRKVRLLSNINGSGLRSHPNVLDHSTDSVLMQSNFWTVIFSIRICLSDYEHNHQSD